MMLYNKGFLFLLFLWVSLLSTAQEREYVLLIHGGAGSMTALEGEPKKEVIYYSALDSALTIGNEILSSGKDAIEAVVAVVTYLENNPLFNAGVGATCTTEGTFELDASIMDGRDLSAGAVASVKHIKNPIMAALAVKEKSPHVLMVGTGAEDFARDHQIEMVSDNIYFATPKTLKWIEELKAKSKKNGTVGCVALDKKGNLAAGTSTGGTANKLKGRIGDTPLIGAGTYADNNSCAVSCTGHGEYFIRHVVAYNLSARLKYLNEDIEKAAHHIIHEELSPHAGMGGLIAIDKKGNFTLPFNSPGMFRGFVYKDKDGLHRAVGIHP